MKWKRGPIIGRGSSATVSMATTTTGDLFAVKSTALSTSKLLQKEHHFLSQLTSKHVIKYIGFDVNYDDNNANKPIYNLFMEYATGGTISDVITTQGGSIDEPLIRCYTHQILLGLDHIHVNHIVHCDIKCRNLLVCEDGAKIGDFGCAKVVGEGGMTGFEFSGTPVFMAPEVARGEEQGFPADVWAVGCVVIEMATGSNPWPEMNDPVAAVYRIGYSGDLPEFPKCLSEEGTDFLGKCLKKDAKERWTVKQLLQHPFVCTSNSSYETRNSPTSTLDQSFWESLHVSEVSTARTAKVNFIGESPMDRIRQLVEAAPLFLPNWDNEDDWITVRSNQEMNVENEDFGSLDLELFSVVNLNVNDDEVVQSLVNDYDLMLEYSIVPRILEFDHVSKNIKSQIIVNSNDLGSNFAFNLVCLQHLVWSEGPLRCSGYWS